MSILMLMLAAVMGDGGQAPPIPMAPAEGVWTAPDWVRKPTDMEIADVYPLRSSLIGEDGKVVITCSVALSGLAENCRVLSETPEGRGFGEAALKASKVMRFRPAMQDGRPVADAQVTIPLAFGASGAAANLPGLSEALACYGRFSARLRADPANEKANLGAQWSRYWANKSMKLERITKPYREKRLAAADKFSAPPPWSDADVRCEAAFLPEAPP